MVKIVCTACEGQAPDWQIHPRVTVNVHLSHLPIIVNFPLHILAHFYPFWLKSWPTEVWEGVCSFFLSVIDSDLCACWERSVSRGQLSQAKLAVWISISVRWRNQTEVISPGMVGCWRRTLHRLAECEISGWNWADWCRQGCFLGSWPPGPRLNRQTAGAPVRHRCTRASIGHRNCLLLHLNPCSSLTHR